MAVSVNAIITILVLRMDGDGAQMWAANRHAVEFLTLRLLLIGKGYINILIS